MDCLITTVTLDSRRVVSVAGRLSIQELPDFLRACAREPGCDLVVDLADLISIDAAAAIELSRLRSEGATLASTPPYIQIMIDQRSRRPTSPR